MMTTGEGAGPEGKGEGKDEAAAAPVPTATVLAVGDELLLGTTVDTNSAWLGRTLTALGVRVLGGITVGDDPGTIGKALTRALADSEWVFVTGGLGPTHDDRTVEAVAAHLGLALHEDPEVVDLLRERFRKRGNPDFPVSNRRQARLPEGGAWIPNSLGTAPGVLLPLPEGGRRVILLPGVPAEMKAMMERTVTHRLRDEVGDRLRSPHRTVLHTGGLAESLLADRLRKEIAAFEAEGGTVAFLPRPGSVDLHLSLPEVAGREAPVEGKAEERFEAFRNRILPKLEGHLYPEGGLLGGVATEALRLGWRVAVAESCTGGWLGKALTELPGAGEWFLGGVIAYENEVKRLLLGVDEELLAREGAVSSAVAERMAEGVAQALGAEVGVGITGIAGPTGGSDAKPVGTVWIAVRDGVGVTSRHFLFDGGRDQIRERSVRAALHMLWAILRNHRGPEDGILG